jgi:hypothetical protein
LAILGWLFLALLSAFQNAKDKLEREITHAPEHRFLKQKALFLDTRGLNLTAMTGELCPVTILEMHRLRVGLEAESLTPTRGISLFLGK